MILLLKTVALTVALAAMLTMAYQPQKPSRSTGIHEIDVEKKGIAEVQPAFDKNSEYRKPFNQGTDPGAKPGTSR